MQLQLNWIKATWLPQRVCSVILLGLSLGACTSEEAEKAKLAAAAIKSAHASAVSSYSTLYLRGAGVEDRPLEQRISELAQREIARASADGTVHETNEERRERLRKELMGDPPSVRAQQAAETEMAPVSQILRALEQAAADYAAAWPFGTQQFICLKDSATALAAGLKRSTLRFNSFEGTRPSGNLYVQLASESNDAARKISQATATKDLAATIEQTSKLRAIYVEEREANAKVQATFALAAQSANNLGRAIDGIATVSIGEILNLIASVVPQLAALNSQADADRIAQKLQITLGKVNGDTWLSHLAEQPTGYTFKCKQP